MDTSQALIPVQAAVIKMSGQMRHVILVGNKRERSLERSLARSSMQHGSTQNGFAKKHTCPPVYAMLPCASLFFKPSIKGAR